MVSLGRRELLEKMYRGLVALGVGGVISFEDLVNAAERPKAKRPKLVWLHGTSCSGCSASFLDSVHVPVVELLTELVDVVFHPDLSLATGRDAVRILEHLVDNRVPAVFVFEGGIPERIPQACMVAEHPVGYWVERLAKNAPAVVAAGTCATRGGITSMPGTLTGAMPVETFLEDRGIDTPLVALPGCPIKPEHIVYVLLHLIDKGGPPALDKRHRPLALFGHTVHERCIYYSDFQEKRFAKQIGEDGCLFRLGCQGPITRNDCLVRGHNGNTNSCIRAGHPCIGCASDVFPTRFMLHAYGDRRVHRKKG